MLAVSAESVFLAWLPTILGSFFFLILLVLALVMRSRIGTAASVLAAIGSVIAICSGAATTLWYEVFFQDVIDANSMTNSEVTTMAQVSSLLSMLAALFGIALIAAAIFTRRPAPKPAAPVSQPFSPQPPQAPPAV